MFLGSSVYHSSLVTMKLISVLLTSCFFKPQSTKWDRYKHTYFQTEISKHKCTNNEAKDTQKVNNEVCVCVCVRYSENSAVQ